MDAPADAPTDTIVAIASGATRAAVGVVRLSGPRAHAIARAIAGRLPAARATGLRTFRDEAGVPLDRGLVLVFVAPHSYTGEDCVELQGHGSPVVLGALVQAACALGARPARPGEFTERAFLNGRIDLVQAEAVADLIESHSRAGAAAALRSLEGEFSRELDRLAASLTDVRVWVEGALDFTDEDVEWLADSRLLGKLDALVSAVSALLARACAGRRLREGMTVVIAGRPNVGKSTLLNRLARAPAAIVTDVPGTTRDLLREHVLIGGLPVTFVDSAGLRETDDVVEREGIRRAWGAIEAAELVLYLFDARSGLDAADRAHLERLPATLPRMLLANKTDLGARAASAFADALPISALTGEGVDALESALLRHAGLHGNEEAVFVARERHLHELRECAAGILGARAQLDSGAGAELVAEELRRAQDALGRIRGAMTSDALLGEIFARFCIGK